MTVNYKEDALYQIRAFLWKQLTEKGIFDLDEYYSENISAHINPIIPVQQTMEMNQFLSGKKHIVYDKIGISYDSNWMICTEQILFTIYTVDYAELNEIRNLMIDQFRRMDDSAKDMNYDSDVQAGKFKYHSIYIADISPTTPSQEMQGFLSTDVILEVKYSRNLDSNGRFL